MILKSTSQVLGSELGFLTPIHLYVTESHYVNLHILVYTEPLMFNNGGYVIVLNGVSYHRGPQSFTTHIYKYIISLAFIAYLHTVVAFVKFNLLVYRLTVEIEIVSETLYLEICHCSFP